MKARCFLILIAVLLAALGHTVLRTLQVRVATRAALAERRQRQACSEALLRPVSIHCRDRRLADVIADLSRQAGAPIDVEWDGEATPDAPVTLDRTDIPLGTAIEAAAGLHHYLRASRFVMRRGAIVFALAEEPKPPAVVRSYDVSALMRYCLAGGGGRRGVSTTAPASQAPAGPVFPGAKKWEVEAVTDELQFIVSESVAPDTWFPPAGRIATVGSRLVIANAPDVQRELSRFLRKLGHPVRVDATWASPGLALDRGSRPGSTGAGPAGPVATAATAGADLSAPVSASFHEARLAEALSSLARQSGANIVMNAENLSTMYMREENPVTLEFKDLALRQALPLVLAAAAKKEPLDYIVRDGVIWIEWRDSVDEESRTVRIYGIGDLLGGGALDEKQLEAAAERVWGPASELLDPGGQQRPLSEDRARVGIWGDCLIVNQTPAGHEKVVELLKTLRAKATPATGPAAGAAN